MCPAGQFWVNFGTYKLNVLTWLELLLLCMTFYLCSYSDPPHTHTHSFSKHLNKARGHIGRNVVEITLKMKTIVWKSLMIKIKSFKENRLSIFLSMQFVHLFVSHLLDLIFTFKTKFEIEPKYLLLWFTWKSSLPSVCQHKVFRLVDNLQNVGKLA